mmetsp:Transcript_88260/g.169127  ORF Transcript_88260/g.169127 Transcript_88260/m.169127 type:complete len:109 (+) Transcript_88260:654-980(+)
MHTGKSSPFLMVKNGPALFEESVCMCEACDCTVLTVCVCEAFDCTVLTDILTAKCGLGSARIKMKSTNLQEDCIVRSQAKFATKRKLEFTSKVHKQSSQAKLRKQSLA